MKERKDSFQYPNHGPIYWFKLETKVIKMHRSSNGNDDDAS